MQNNNEMVRKMSQEEEKNQNLAVQFLNEVKKWHNKGILPVYLGVFVVIFNFVAFSWPADKILYLLIEILLVIIAFFTRYWELKLKFLDRPGKIKIILGYFSISLFFLLDIFISISYIPGSNNSYSLLSVPTLIIDIIGIISFFIFVFHK